MNRAPWRERREGRRWTMSECRWLTSARLRHGVDVDVLNLSTAGALIELAARLLPGATVEMHLGAADWAFSSPARVLRCYVSALSADDGVRYQAALRFDRPVPLRRDDNDDFTRHADANHRA